MNSSDLIQNPDIVQEWLKRTEHGHCMSDFVIDRSDYEWPRHVLNITKLAQAFLMLIEENKLLRNSKIIGWREDDMPSCADKYYETIQETLKKLEDKK